MVLCVFADLKSGRFQRKDFSRSPPVSTVKTFAESEQFGVYFGQFRQLPLNFFMCCDTGARLCPLFGSFEQKFSDLAAPQTLHKVEKRAVLESPPATAIGFAARQVLFDIGRPQKI
jgi:hypothetical protein